MATMTVHDPACHGDRPQDAAVLVAEVPLVVDLDGTLIRNDLLLEAASAFVTHHPLRLPSLLIRLAKTGRSGLKAQLAESMDLDPDWLLFNESVLAWLKEQKAHGRTLLLATASHRRFAETVASRLGCFDQVFATELGLNLSAHAKRDLLVAHFGERGFDYIGNSEADLVVWKVARQAHVVSDGKGLVAKVRAQGNLRQLFSPELQPRAKLLLKAMRPHQWLKNLLIFVPLLAAHIYSQPGALRLALLAFVTFSMTASSAYLLNDLVDLSHDRNHERKRRRPFASGNLSLLSGWVAWPVLLILAFALATATLPGAFGGVLALYYLSTLAYSFHLKHSPITDVIVLGGLYTVRLIAGGVATAVPLSFWLLSFSMFLFLSLAFMKRFTELLGARLAGRTASICGRSYIQGDLEMVSSMGIASGYIAVLVLALYVQFPPTIQLYRSPRVIWASCPLLFFWISRVWFKAHRNEMHDDPIVFAIKDPTSLIIGACFFIVFALATLHL